MREPSLYKTTAFSLFLHVTLFLIAFIILKQSNRIIIPSPYIVNLVSPDTIKGKQAEILNSMRTASMEDLPAKGLERVTKKDEEMAMERISAIAAKKRVERIVKLRSIIAVKAGGDKNINSQKISTPAGKGDVFDDYYSKITGEIWRQWIFPDTGQKNLEAIVSIRIMKDGRVSVQKMEKSSGNPLFDKSAVRALTKANPLPPPPYEMEIGVRFFL
ncbi:MAG: energy transducer TonB [Nitrospirota bacterium]